MFITLSIDVAALDSNLPLIVVDDIVRRSQAEHSVTRSFPFLQSFRAIYSLSDNGPAHSLMRSVRPEVAMASSATSGTPSAPCGIGLLGMAVEKSWLKPASCGEHELFYDIYFC